MEEFKNISIRGRMAYLISSFENVLLHYVSVINAADKKRVKIIINPEK